MARKKQEIALQAEIETQEEWEEMLAKEGLTVVDVFQDWCGPCKAMLGQLKRVKNEVGDDLLHFAVAKADTIDALEKYRGKCEPCFLFFAGGVLVSVVRGANSPLVTRTIAEQLAQEHKVLDGDSERKEIRDPMLGEMESKEKGEADAEEQEKEDEDMEPQKKAITVAIIKPDAVKAGKVDEIMEKMQESGIEILKHEERCLTDEEARDFYRHLKEESYFDSLVDFMCSGPSHVLVLTKGETGENIVDEWRELLGPKTVEEAKESAPDSLRAQYGESEMMNALHGSDSQDRAMAELAFFFPDYNLPIVPGTGPKPKIERTLALIRPDAAREHKDEILAKIKEAGFQIALMKEMQITKEQAEEFYSEHRDQPYFDDLTSTMSSGPLIALGLAREQAITAWRDMLGPKEVQKAQEEAPESQEEKPEGEEQGEKPEGEQTEGEQTEGEAAPAEGEEKPTEATEGEEQKEAAGDKNLRAQFAITGSVINPLHGSDSQETAKKEIEFFFPMQKTMAVIKPDAYQTKDDIMDKIREAGFHIAARKETEVTKDIAESLYKDCADKDYYGDITEHMASGKTLFMVLTREDAVEGWRGLIGPTDPEKAKEVAPDSIRAQFGQDIKANAVHGASNITQAEEEIKAIFGEIEINSDGPPVGDDAPAAEEKQEAQAGEGTPAESATEEQPAEATESAEQQEQESAGESAEQSAEQTEQSAEQSAEQTPDAEGSVAGSGEGSEQKASGEGSEEKPSEAGGSGEGSEEKPSASEAGDTAETDTKPTSSPTGSAEEKAEGEPSEKEDSEEKAPSSADAEDKPDDQPSAETVATEKTGASEAKTEESEKPSDDADKSADEGAKSDADKTETSGEAESEAVSDKTPEEVAAEDKPSE